MGDNLNLYLERRLGKRRNLHQHARRVGDEVLAMCVILDRDSSRRVCRGISKSDS